SLAHSLWGGTAGVDLTGLHDRGDWGSPLPVDVEGVPVPGFDRDRNYAIRDAEVKHDVFGVNTHGSWRANGSTHLDNTLGYSYDAQSVNAWSRDIGAMLRLLPDGTEGIEALNLYVSWKSSIKPAAPNLTEAEAAKILDPEHSHSIEGGLKARALSGQLALDLSG